ncbi:unnamed protein product [Gadus morhua 'NCC']
MDVSSGWAVGQGGRLGGARWVGGRRAEAGVGGLLCIASGGNHKGPQWGPQWGPEGTECGARRGTWRSA